MKRRSFLKAILVAPAVGLAAVKVAEPVKTCSQSEQQMLQMCHRIYPPLDMEPGGINWAKASDRIKDALRRTKKPIRIDVASDVFAELTDEFVSKVNVKIYRVVPKPMYFSGYPVREFSILESGTIDVYSSGEGWAKELSIFNTKLTKA